MFRGSRRYGPLVAVLLALLGLAALARGQRRQTEALAGLRRDQREDLAVLRAQVAGLAGRLPPPTPSESEAATAPIPSPGWLARLGIVLGALLATMAVVRPVGVTAISAAWTTTTASALGSVVTWALVSSAVYGLVYGAYFVRRRGWDLGLAMGLIVGPLSGMAYAIPLAALAALLAGLGDAAGPLQAMPYTSLGNFFRGLAIGLGAGLLLARPAAGVRQPSAHRAIWRERRLIGLPLLTVLVIEFVLDHAVFTANPAWTPAHWLFYPAAFVLHLPGIWLGWTLGVRCSAPLADFYRRVGPPLARATTALVVWLLGCIVIVVWSASLYYNLRCEEWTDLTTIRSRFEGEGTFLFPTSATATGTCPRASLAFEELQKEGADEGNAYSTYLYYAAMNLVTIQDSGLKPRTPPARAALGLQLGAAFFWTLVILVLVLDYSHPPSPPGSRRGREQPVL